MSGRLVFSTADGPAVKGAVHRGDEWSLSFTPGDTVFLYACETWSYYSRVTRKNTSHGYEMPSKDPAGISYSDHVTNVEID